MGQLLEPSEKSRLNDRLSLNRTLGGQRRGNQLFEHLGVHGQRQHSAEQNNAAPSIPAHDIASHGLMTVMPSAWNGATPRVATMKPRARAMAAM